MEDIFVEKGDWEKGKKRRGGSRKGEREGRQKRWNGRIESTLMREKEGKGRGMVVLLLLVCCCRGR